MYVKGLVLLKHTENMVNSNESYTDIKNILNVLEKNLRKQKKEISIVEKLGSALMKESNYEKFLKLSDLNIEVMKNRITLYDLVEEGVFDSTYEAVIINALREDQVYDLISSNLKKQLSFKKNGVKIKIVVRKISSDANSTNLNPIFCNVTYVLTINQKNQFYTSLKGLINSLKGRNIKSKSIEFKEVNSSRTENSFLESNFNVEGLCE